MIVTLHLPRVTFRAWKATKANVDRQQNLLSLSLSSDMKNLIISRSQLSFIAIVVVKLNRVRIFWIMNLTNNKTPRKKLFSMVEKIFKFFLSRYFYYIFKIWYNLKVFSRDRFLRRRWRKYNFIRRFVIDEVNEMCFQNRIARIATYREYYLGNCITMFEDLAKSVSLEKFSASQWLYPINSCREIHAISIWKTKLNEMELLLLETLLLITWD